ncbi:MAG: hypothetical protein Q9162_006295 [Coniocarpon cinnabarinum]
MFAATTSLATATALFAVFLSLAVFRSGSLLRPGKLVVDLPYQSFQGFVVNNSLVTFKNVRYAAAPVGDLRFKAPISPSINSKAKPIKVSDVICPQGYAQWFQGPTNKTFGPEDILLVDPRTSEDCLVLDMLMTESVWKSRTSESAPVLVWIHGGGFAAGWKDMSGAGHGLVTRSLQYSEHGLILVSINYRLGLFGWLYGPGAVANAGLKDQRLALEWVQQHIHRFGGNASQVTVMGESAGGGSIAAHIAAYKGEKGNPPFRGAIAQSPYYLPTSPHLRSTVDGVLDFANVSSLDALRLMSTTDLQILNALLIGNALTGFTTFTLVPDGEYIPEALGRLYRSGSFDKSVTLMTGHNVDEGSLFVSKSQILDNEAYTSYVASLLSLSANDTATLKHVTETLYPLVFDGSQGYTHQTGRNSLTYADAAIVCNARAMNAASFDNPTFAYVWNVPPGMHGMDLAYTFYDFGDVPCVNTTVAEALQGYILLFVAKIDPNSNTLPEFPSSSSSANVINIGSEAFFEISDENEFSRLKERCDYWQAAPFLQAPLHTSERFQPMPEDADSQL